MGNSTGMSERRKSGTELIGRTLRGVKTVLIHLLKTLYLQEAFETKDGLQRISNEIDGRLSKENMVIILCITVSTKRINILIH